jgi:hypothetical protein
MWLKNGRKYANPPLINDSAQFSTSWWAWWQTLQPKWRVNNNTLSQEIPSEGETWTATSKPGCNGFFVVLLTLSWWLQTAVHDVNDFHAALSDTMWVLDQMITYHGVQKRLHDDEDVDDISHKKR